MKKITKLTPEQKARFPEFVEKWTRIGLCTDPADFDAAEKAARACYACANLKQPKIVLHMGSPFGAVYGGILGVILLRKRGNSEVESKVWSKVWSEVESKVGSEVRSEVWSKVRSEVWSKVWSEVWSEVGSEVRSEVWSKVRSEVWSKVWSEVESKVRSKVESEVGSEVWSKVGSEVWSKVGSEVESKVRSEVGSEVWSEVGSEVRSEVGSLINQYRGAQLWASWYSYITFFRDVCGWKNDALTAFAHDEALGSSCGWIWWDDDVCAISDRPRILRRDEQNRLHCQNGPALLYPDGWSIYSWHGVTIPEEWIEQPDMLTPSIALNHRNIEQRRVACEILGWDRILKELNAHIIDKDDDPQIGELLEVTIPEIGKERFLRVLCGTGRTFAIPMPPHVKTALEGNAWSYDIPKNLMQRKELRT